MSWHDFVNSDGAVADSLRQLPLWLVSAASSAFNVYLPDVAVGKMPPSYGLGVFHGEYLSDHIIF